jgi:hypothetical protein
LATEFRSSLDEVVRDRSARTLAWEDKRTFPVRYACSEEEYLALDVNLLVEFADGFAEVLPLPATRHRRIVAFL